MKLVHDALNGLVWEDDGQIADLHLVRRYCAREPCIALSVEEYDRSLNAVYRSRKDWRS